VTEARDESGTGVPHSKTLPQIIVAPLKFREVLECGTPVPLSSALKPSAARLRRKNFRPEKILIV
jgi:hypothetical protein